MGDRIDASVSAVGMNFNKLVHLLAEFLHKISSVYSLINVDGQEMLCQNMTFSESTILGFIGADVTVLVSE